MQLVRANQQHKDGFKLWFQMCREFLPATRQRSLAIGSSNLRSVSQLQQQDLHAGEHPAV